MNFYEQIFSRGRATGEGMTHFERLFAAKFGGSPSPEVREYTGAVPVTITADGTPLIDYLISGNTTQSGTPTPDNPVMPQGTGERTENLLNTANSTNGYLLADGSMTTPHANLYTTDYIAIPTGVTKITQSYNLGDPMLSPAMCFYDSSKAYISGEAFQRATAKTFEVPSGAVYFRTCYRTTFEWCMVNKGSTALPYEPYGFEISISSASTTTPVYLGEVQTTRKIKKYEFTGTESWVLYNNNYFSTAVDNSATQNAICQCSHLESALTSGIYIGAGNARLKVFSNSVSSVATSLTEWKNYLAAQYAAGTPVTVWYILENLETAVVNEPLMRIGDYADTLSKAQALVSIPTNNGSTTIDVDTELKPSEIYIKYMG